MRAYKRWLFLLMAALALGAGAAQGADRLSAEKVLVARSHPSAVKHRRRTVDPRRIAHERAVTWRWQAIMGVRPTRLAVRPSTRRTLRAWERVARQAFLDYTNPPHKRAWLCIHRFEGSWSDSGDPYWGGLQMDRGFMEYYAARSLLRRGWANRWSPLEQMWVAERAFRSGRGFYAWPNTARYCGLI